MADRKALLVVIRVDEPAGDAFGAVGAHAAFGVKYIHPVDLDLQLIALLQNVDVRLTRNNKQIAFAGILEIFSHVQVGVHACFECRYVTKLVEIGGVCLVVEGASNQHVKFRSPALQAAATKSGRATVPNSGPDEDGSTLLDAALWIDVAAFGADQLATLRRKRSKVDLVLLVRLPNPGRLEVLQDHPDKVAFVAVARDALIGRHRSGHVAEHQFMFRRAAGRRSLLL